MTYRKHFLNPKNTDMLTQVSLRLKAQLSHLPFYARQETEIGDLLWTRLAMSWYGAAISAEDVKAVLPNEFLTTKRDPEWPAS